MPVLQQESSRKVRCSSSGVDCFDLPADCFDCKYNQTCIYGDTTDVECGVISGASCEVSHP